MDCHCSVADAPGLATHVIGDPVAIVCFLKVFSRYGHSYKCGWQPVQHSCVMPQVRFIQFTAAGDPVSLKGDYFAGKGVGWAQLETPAGIVDTFNTHLSANYKQSWRGELQGPPGSFSTHGNFVSRCMAPYLQHGASLYQSVLSCTVC